MDKADIIIGATIWGVVATLVFVFLMTVNMGIKYSDRVGERNTDACLTLKSEPLRAKCLIGESK